MKVAIIGAGAMGRHHLQALSHLSQVQIVGVCDVSSVMAEAAAERFRIPGWFSDYQEMLSRTRPEVVHVTTPAETHFDLCRAALEHDCHVFVEKPVTSELDQLHILLEEAQRRSRWLIEDHNYLWNRSTREIIQSEQSGALGEVLHVEILIALNLMEPGNRFSDPGAPHPALGARGGAASDFLSHLCYLSHAFTGDHRGVHSLWHDHPHHSARGYYDVRAQIEGARATAWIAFSARGQPDTFTLRVHGSRQRAECNLFETGLVRSRLLGGPRVLHHLRNGMARAGAEASAAIASLMRKIRGGPGALEGVYALIRETYRALTAGGPPPIQPHTVRCVNELVQTLLAEAPH